MAHITYSACKRLSAQEDCVQNYQNYIKSRAKNSGGGYNAEEQRSGQIPLY